MNNNQPVALHFIDDGVLSGIWHCDSVGTAQSLAAKLFEGFAYTWSEVANTDATVIHTAHPIWDQSLVIMPLPLITMTHVNGNRLPDGSVLLHPSDHNVAR